MKHNIIQLIYTLDDGGAETLIKDYALLSDKEKFNVTVVVKRKTPSSANYKALSENNIPIISVFSNNSFLFKVVQKLNEWWYIPYRLSRIFKSLNPDVIHIHLRLLHFLSPISDNLKNIKLFYTCHNELKVHLEPKKENRAARYLIVNNDLQMIALHDKMRKEINEMFGIDNTVVIRNGIDFNRFRNVAVTKEQVRERLNIPADAFVVGHVGRFHKQKNHTFLVDVFGEVCKKNKNAFLLLVGDGALKKAVEDKLDRLGCNDRCLILSHRSDIPELLRAMDVFVFPSLYEGIPLTLIEAQVSGLRCIVSDAVSTEAFQTELAVPASLNESASRWCDIILDDSIKGEAHGNIEDYDMNKEIKRLEMLYLGELDD
jgi:glycosyltransferase involved in cell wall biosynthesis